MAPPFCCDAPKREREEQSISKGLKLESRMNCMNHEANHVPSSDQTDLSWRSLDGVAHQPFCNAGPWHCCGRLAIVLSTSHPPTPPNNPSYPHTISGAPKLIQRYLSATRRNQMKETKYKALRIRNYLHVMLLLHLLSAARRLLLPNTPRGVVVSNSLHPSLVPKVLQ